MVDALYHYVRLHDYEAYIAALLTKDPVSQRYAMSVFAFKCELEHIHHIAREPMAGLIRLAWWRERLDDIYRSGLTQKQPTLEALNIFVQDRHPPQELFAALLDAAGNEMEGQPSDFELVARELVRIAVGDSRSNTLSFLEHIERKKAKKNTGKQGNNPGWLPFRALMFDLLTK